jgi:hypothetical protein
VPPGWAVLSNFDFFCAVLEPALRPVERLSNQCVKLTRSIRAKGFRRYLKFAFRQAGSAGQKGKTQFASKIPAKFG